MELKNYIHELYDKYNINSNYFRKTNKDNLQLFNSALVNKTSIFKDFKIETSVIKEGRLLFEDGIINRSSFNIRSNDATFINVAFYDLQFINCGIKNSVFINCYFEGITFKSSAISYTYFINCRFDNCQMTDFKLEKVTFVNSIPDILDITLEKKLSQIYNDGIEIINDDSLFDFININLNKDNNLAKLPSKKDRKEIKTTMKETILEREYTNTDDLIINNKNFENCIFTNISISAKAVDSTNFKNCIFKNCNFIQLKFFGTIFDGSNFINCIFKETEMYRCSLEEVNIDHSSTFNSKLISCHLFDTVIDCNTEDTVFNKTFKPVITQKKENNKVCNYNTVIDDIKNLLSKIESDEFVNSVQKPKEPVTEEEIYTYFSKKNINEAMLIISSITSMFCQQNLDNTAKTPNNANNEM